MKGIKTEWTEEMIEKLKAEFPFRFTRDIGKEMNISSRTVIRKARDLGIEKEEGFLEKNRASITKLATAALPPNPYKGIKGWQVPNGEAYQFKKGNVSPMKDEKIKKKAINSRNETIRKEKLRIKYGLTRKTKLKLR